MAEFNYDSPTYIMGTEAYEMAKEVIRKEININKPVRNAAAPRLSAPREYSRPDYREFRKTPQERGQLLSMKAQHRRELQQVYGKEWKNHLNIPSRKLDSIIKLTF